MAAPETKPVPDARAGWLTLSAVCLVSMIMSLDMNTLNIALPIVNRQFQASPTAASWLLLAYMLTNCALLVPFGRIADALGQRFVYLAGLTVFIAGAIGCGFAPNIETLIVLRTVQAIGSAALLANGATLIHNAMPPSRLSHALGLYSASFSVAGLIGPTIGGLIAEVGGWRWVFWFSIPLAIPALIWGYMRISAPPPSDKKPSMDVAGNSVLMMILILATYGISRGSEVGWTNPLIMWPLIASVVLVPVLVLIERRASNPVLDVEVFGSNGVGSILMAGFLNAAARWPVVLIMGLYFQAVLDKGPAAAGIYLLPVPFGMIIFAILLGNLSQRYTAGTLVTVGASIGLVGQVLLLIGAMMRNEWVIVAALLILGSSTGIFMGSNTSALLLALPERFVGVGNAVRLMLQNVANLLCVAVSLALIAGVLPKEKRSAVMQADAAALGGDAAELAAGFNAALILLVVLAVLCVISCVRGQRATARREAALV